MQILHLELLNLPEKVNSYVCEYERGVSYNWPKYDKEITVILLKSGNLKVKTKLTNKANVKEKACMDITVKKGQWSYK